VLSPGPIATPGLASLVPPDHKDTLFQQLASAVPMGRLDDAAEVAKAADRVFGEYEAQGHVLSTDKLYKQTYAGLLVAEHGKIKLNDSPLRPSRGGCTLDSCEGQCDHRFRSRAGSEWRHDRRGPHP
jgi:hypothetical protein